MITQEEVLTTLTQWYKGLAADGAGSSADLGSFSSGTAQHTLTDLVAGTYWVEVSDPSSNGKGCSSIIEYTLESNFETPSVDVATASQVTIVGDEDCSTNNGSGSISILSVVLTDEDGATTTVTDVFANFTVELYTSPATIGVPDATATQILTTNDVEFTNLEAGDYFIYINRNIGTVTNCNSGALIPVTVPESYNDP